MSSKSQQKNATQDRILVVDDELDVNISLHMVLETNGFKVDSFSDPREVLQKFRPGIYDLIILDIKMPHLNGLALYRELKKIDREAKICFLTAGEMFYGDYSDIFNSVGADGFMRKPIENQKLIERVRKIISS
jgi:two-component system response regulator ChvI